MNDDALEKGLKDAMGEEERGPEPADGFREELRERTARELPAPRGRLARLRTILTATAAAALLVVSMVVFGPGGPGAEGPPPAGDGEVELADGSRLAEARSAPSFQAEGLASRLYGDPVEYLRKQGVDTTVAGLVGTWNRLASGEETGIESAKWAILDALSRRAGSAFAPLLTELWAVDTDPGARRHILLMLRRTRDRVVAPWLDARVADAPAGLLLDVARARVAMHRPDPATAAVLARRAGEFGWLDPQSEGYNAWNAADVLYAIHALGDPEAVERFSRLLAAAPTSRLLFAAHEALGEAPVPAAYRQARDVLVDRALVSDDPGFDEVKLLDVLGRTRDERFVPLLRRLLEDDYVPLAVDAARVAGAWRVEDAWTPLVLAWERAQEMGEDGEDLIPPVLWAAARCGDGQAIPRLADFLEENDWYRAGEWAVDALLDLQVPVGTIIRLLPNQTWAAGKLPDLLDRVTMDALGEIDAKIKSLPDGLLKSALRFARDRGAGPEVRDYLRAVFEHGGNLGLYLTFSDPAKVREVLAAGENDHDAEMALRAVPILPAPEAERRELAAAALASPRPRIREAAAAALARLGGEEAVAVLKGRLPAESVPAVRDRIAAALASLGVVGPRAVLLGEVPEGSALARILRIEERLRSDPEGLREELAGAEDALSAGYRLLFEGVRRKAKPDPVGDLFDYEVLR